jgi:iron(III) transport system ATP-binding protein
MVSLHFQNVSKLFDKTTAVNDLTLDIREGELFFLLGPSGCGKTTCLRMVAGFLTPDKGVLTFDERPMNRVPPHKRNTGMVFQNYALWPHLSVRGNVEYGLRVRKFRAKNATAAPSKPSRWCASMTCPTATRTSFRADSSNASPWRAPS